jgi:hypothetical protein
MPSLADMLDVNVEMRSVKAKNEKPLAITFEFSLESLYIILYLIK